MIIKIVLIMIAAIIGLANYLTKVIMHPKQLTYEQVYNMECERLPEMKETYESFKFEEMTHYSFDGTPLSLRIFDTEAPKGTFIVVHGIRVNQMATVKYAKLFQAMGFQVVTLDLRNHGKSGGDFTTYGVLEKKDLESVVSWVKAQPKLANLPIYTHGESMGAATAIMHAAMDQRIKGVIADCGFATGYQIFSERVKLDQHLPPEPLLTLADGLYYLKTGIHFKEMSTIKAIGEVKVPLLLIHGTYDRYVTISHGEALLKASNGADHIWIEGAGHTKSFARQPDKYREAILNWCIKNNI